MLKLNRMCSMTFGRPPLLPNYYLQTDPPADVELEQLAGNPVYGPTNVNYIDFQPSRLHHVGLAFVSTPQTILIVKVLMDSDSKLYPILGDIIQSVYGSNLDNSGKPGLLGSLLSEVLNTEHELSEWIQGLPSGLVLTTLKQMDNGSPSDDVQAQRSQVILTLRYLNVRILLHRAVLERLLIAPKLDLGNSRQNYVSSTAISSIDRCIDAAMETISMVSRSSYRQEILPVWWYSIYFCK
jgi:hypothetical protein